MYDYVNKQENEYALFTDTDSLLFQNTGHTWTCVKKPNHNDPISINFHRCLNTCKYSTNSFHSFLRYCSLTFCLIRGLRQKANKNMFPSRQFRGKTNYEIFWKMRKLNFLAILGTFCPSMTKRRLFFLNVFRQFLDSTITNNKPKSEKTTQFWENARVTYLRTNWP